MEVFLHPATPEIEAEIKLAIDTDQMSKKIKDILHAHLDTHKNTFTTLLAAFPEGDPEVKKAATELMCDTTKTVATPPTVSNRTSAYERNPEMPGSSYIKTDISFSPMKEFEGVWVREETVFSITQGQEQTLQKFRLVGSFGPPRKEEPKRLTLEKTPKTQS